LRACRSTPVRADVAQGGRRPRHRVATGRRGPSWPGPRGPSPGKRSEDSCASMVTAWQPGPKRRKDLVGIGPGPSCLLIERNQATKIGRDVTGHYRQVSHIDHQLVHRNRPRDWHPLTHELELTDVGESW